MTGLYPGASQSATVTVTNPNAQSLTVTAVTVGTITGPAGCSGGSANLLVTPPGSPQLPTVVAGGGNTTLTLTVAMPAGAANACQTATFTIPVTVTGRLG